MCDRKFQEVKKILDAKGATGIGTPMEVSEFMHLVGYLATASNANLTVKFQGSIQEAMPDFSASQSKTNMWTYIQIKDLKDGSSIDGGTGIAMAGTDDFRQFELNVNGLKWINAVVTAYSVGSVDVGIKPFSNQ
jgi:hypothetical protein